MQYGKFKSADELFKGYTQLEKSFTQRCQRVAELERQLQQNQTVQPQNGQIDRSQTEGILSTESKALPTNVATQQQTVPQDNVDKTSQVTTPADSNAETPTITPDPIAPSTQNLPTQNDTAQSSAEQPTLGATDSFDQAQLLQYLLQHRNQLGAILGMDTSAHAPANRMAPLPIEQTQPPTQPHLTAYFATPKVMMGGGNVSMAAPSRPRTIREASILASELFK